METLISSVLVVSLITNDDALICNNNSVIASESSNAQSVSIITFIITIISGINRQTLLPYNNN